MKWSPDVGRLAAWAQRHEHRLVRRLLQLVAGLVATGLVVVNPPTLASTGGAADQAGPTGPALISARTPSSVFAGSTERGRPGVEASALGLVASLGGLHVRPGDWAPWVRSGTSALGLDRCPPGDLAVSWVPPVGDHEDGAYVTPLGPPPTRSTTRVNGVVECRTSDYAFLGFEAEWNGARWLLAAVPSLHEETGGPLLEGEAEAAGATPAEVHDDASGAPALPAAGEWDGTPLEPLTAYVPQTTCDPVAKPGVLGFRDLLLGTFPGSRNLGIGRVCEAEGVSEHKEGRAFDWGVNVDDPAERAAADAVLAWMLGPDQAGNEYAIARRLGLMYVIWDGRIWSSFLASEGWRPYVGRSPHRDHIHFSFDWAGARAQSSFWQGGHVGLAAGAAPDLPLLPAAPRPPLPFPGLPALPALPPPGLFGSEPAPAGEASSSEPPPPPPSSTTTTTSPPPSTTTTTSPPPSTTTTTQPVIPLTTPTTFGVGSL